MALSLSQLQGALEDILETAAATPAAAATQFAQAYHDYAKGGRFLLTSVPTLTNAHRDAMKTTLEGAIANPLTGAAATFAGAWTTAVTAYWTSVPVAGAAGNGTTTPPAGAGSLTGALTTVFSNIANTYAICASGMAAALDTCTKTVPCVLGPPTNGSANLL